jgi:homoaconitase/3-isopropylmalate dehydratase large subunit
MAKHPGGRPLKFKSNKELQEKIDSYFAKMDAEKRPYTICGMAVELECDRLTLINYEKREEYFNTIKKAKQRIEAYAEERLFGNSVAGVIFNLKNNYGWKDTMDNNVKIDVVESALREIHGGK